MCPSSTTSSERLLGVSAEDGLILHDPEVFGTGAVRVVSWIVTLAFIATIVVSPLVDQLAPAPLPELEGDEAQDEERLRADADLWDGSLARLVERDLRLTSRVRAELVPHWAHFLFYNFQLTDERVIVGPNGWVFMPIRLAPRRRATDDDVLRFGLSWLAALDRVVAAQGVELVYVPIPRKSVTHPEELPRGAADPRPDLYGQFAALLANERIAHVDLLERFLAEARDKDLYFPTDTHWSDWGAAIAAEETCRQLGWLIPPQERAGRLEERGETYAQGDLMRFMGIAWSREVGHPTPVVQLVDDDGDLRFQKQAVTIDRVELDEMPAVAVAGTSFTERRKLVPFLEHYSGRTIWNGARRGGNAIEPLRDLMTRAPGERPLTVLVELPFHQITFNQALKGCAQLVADLFPANAPELDVSAGLEVDAAFAKPVPLFRSFVDLLALPEGRLQTDTHAALGIRLEGRADHPVEVLVVIDGPKEELEWDPSTGPFVVPIRAERTVDAVRLRVRSTTPQASGDRFELVRATVVSGLDETGARRARLEPRHDAGGASITTARFDPAPLPPRAALRVELGDGGAAPAEVAVELFDGERSLQRTTWARVLPGGRIVVNLAPLVGEEPTHAVVRVEGAAPPNLADVVAAVVLAGTPTATR